MSGRSQAVTSSNTNIRNLSFYPTTEQNNSLAELQGSTWIGFTVWCRVVLYHTARRSNVRRTRRWCYHLDQLVHQLEIYPVWPQQHFESSRTLARSSPWCRCKQTIGKLTIGFGNSIRAVPAVPTRGDELLIPWMYGRGGKANCYPR